MKYKKKQIRKWQNIINNKVFQWNTYNEKGHEILYDGNVHSICRRIEKHKKVIGLALGFARSRDNDFRSGDETYGYETLKSIDGELFYICDRCHCSFRFAWLKEVPQKVQELTNEHSN